MTQEERELLGYLTGCIAVLLAGTADRTGLTDGHRMGIYEAARRANVEIEIPFSAPPIKPVGRRLLGRIFNW